MRIPTLAWLLLPLGLFLAAPALAEEEDAPASRIWQRLERMDADGDGEVTREEFRGPDRFWNRLDGDGDGVVTRAEADAVAERMGDRTGRGGARGMGGRARGGGLSFEALDLDRDGSVSASEWSAFMEKADENGDGILQQEEWDAATRGRPLRDAAPEVGSTAPKVSAKRFGQDQRVDLGAPRRTTVLIFGSWT